MKLSSKESTKSNKENKQKKTAYSTTITHVKRSFITGLIIGAVVVLIAVVSTTMPYAITIEGEELCYVRNKEKAGKVTQEIIDAYIPEGTTLQAVEMEGNFTVDNVSLGKALKVDCVSVDEAVKIVKSRLEDPDEFVATEEGKSAKNLSEADKAVDDIIVKAEASDGDQAEEKPAVEEKKKEDKAASEDKNDEEAAAEEKTDKEAATEDKEDKKDEDAAAKEKADGDKNEEVEDDRAGIEPAIVILSTKQVSEEYEAAVKYVKDDTMLAGDSEVVEKGSKGMRDVLRQYTTSNGELIETKDLQVETVKEAEPKVVKKGTLGLPEGEDWKTYEGDPIFNDGEALVKTAQNYLGAPYKYGGYSLTTGIDCVQFIRQMYAKYGIKLPNGKNALKHVGTAVSYENAKPGDIICYTNHYALYLGDGKIVHATPHGGVSVRNNAKYRKIVTVRRIPRS